MPRKRVRYCLSTPSILLNKMSCKVKVTGRSLLLLQSKPLNCQQYNILKNIKRMIDLSKWYCILGNIYLWNDFFQFIIWIFHNLIKFSTKLPQPKILTRENEQNPSEKEYRQIKTISIETILLKVSEFAFEITEMISEIKCSQVWILSICEMRMRFIFFSFCFLLSVSFRWNLWSPSAFCIIIIIGIIQWLKFHWKAFQF